MKFLKYIVLVSVSNLAIGQVGIGTTSPNSSAALDITSTNSGLLIPRVTEIEKQNIASPATGLLVFQTDGASGFWYFNGTAWTPFVGSGDNWGLSTNTGTTPAVNKLGTLDNNPLIIKTNNQEALRVTPTGNVGINTTTPTSKLNVKTNLSGSFLQNFESFTPVPYDITTNSANPIYTYASCNSTSANLWRINTKATSNYTCSGCAGNAAIIRMSTCLEQDATLVVKIGSFTESSVSINFNYGYNFSLSPDSFRVELFNETSNSTESILLLKAFDAMDQTFSQISPIIPGNNYSLRFRFVYKGTTSSTLYGAQVDNISVIPQNPALRIVDGNQALGYVLISDANGNGSWTNPGTASPDDDWRFNSGSLDSDPIYRTGNVRIGYVGTPRTLLDVYNNQGDGTQIGIGSDEFITDGLNEFFVSNSIIPSTDNTLSIGRSGLRWAQIFATNGVINTSDAREKEEIQPIKYGINEINCLQPVSYFWKNEKNANRKIGFIAQELQEVLPETVQDKEWVIKKGTLTQENAEHLGVSYSEILPVVVKSIQEHQSTLKSLEQEIDTLIALTKNKN